MITKTLLIFLVFAIIYILLRRDGDDDLFACLITLSSPDGL
ncbi:hypothetical protein [Mucilaginibacter sp. SMC90]|nr:hypothetical protein [Mucilaginibacter sp. SMC90]